jgi:hypothetical protein
MGSFTCPEYYYMPSCRIEEKKEKTPGYYPIKSDRTIRLKRNNCWNIPCFPVDKSLGSPGWFFTRWSTRLWSNFSGSEVVEEVLDSGKTTGINSELTVEQFINYFL